MNIVPGTAFSLLATYFRGNVYFEDDQTVCWSSEFVLRKQFEVSLSGVAEGQNSVELLQGRKVWSQVQLGFAKVYLLGQ